MFLHRWSKLSQILHMSYCSSCRHYLLPSRGISRVKWGDRFPYSIPALRNAIRKVCSQQRSLITYLWASPFWKQHFNVTVEICIEQFTYIILFLKFRLKLASLLKPHLLSMDAYSLYNVYTTDDTHYSFVQLQSAALRLLTLGGAMARY